MDGVLERIAIALERLAAATEGQKYPPMIVTTSGDVKPAASVTTANPVPVAQVAGPAITTTAEMKAFATRFVEAAGEKNAAMVEEIKKICNSVGVARLSAVSAEKIGDVVAAIRALATKENITIK